MPSVRKNRIDRLEIFNFKSYEGHQRIGPFKNFTAIIGPNGVGKSNLMDAISFVLGIKSMHLRGSQLKDLIHAKDDEESDKIGRKAYVKLIMALETGVEVSFARTITSSGSAEYKIDDATVSMEEYSNTLKSLGILVKARNFLVFQGYVESIVSKNPKELTALFEQISGSDEFKKDYETFLAERNSADENAATVYQKKRTITLERKQRKDQKSEAEKHLNLQNELKELKTEYYLWQLYNIENDSGKFQNEFSELEEEMKKIESIQSNVDERIQEKKRLQATVMKDVYTNERKLERKNAELEKRRPEIVRLTEEIRSITKKRASLEEEIQKKEKMKTQQSSEVAQLEKSLVDINAALRNLMEESERGGGKLAMAEEQLQRYREIKGEAGRKTTKVRQELETEKRQKLADQTKFENLELNIQQLNEREKQLKNQIVDFKNKKSNLSRELNSAEQEFARLKMEENLMLDKHRREKTLFNHLTANLETLDAELRELRADKKEGEREVRARENALKMKQLFMGVHGKLSDLCKPIQKKYNLPISVTMGKFLDAIVVDNEKAAKDCIEYLRENRQPPMCFLPLQNLRVKPLNEQYRNLGKTSKLVADVIQFDSFLKNAILYAVGSTLVCDSIEEGRELAWGREQRYKVVTLDGTILSKNGMMTGGSSGGMEARAQRWDENKIAELKQTRERKQKELNELPSLRSMSLIENEMAMEISSVEKKLNFGSQNMAMIDNKISSLENDVKIIQEEKEKMLPELNWLHESTSGRDARIQTFENRINEISDAIFQSFSASVGVTNIREYEEKELKKSEQFSERKQNLTTQIARIQNQLDYEKKRDMQAPIQKLADKMSSCNQQLVGLRGEANRVKSEMDGIIKEIHQLKNALSDFTKSRDRIEQELNALKNELNSISTRKHTINRQIASKESELEQSSVKKNQVLENCEINEIRIKTEEGDTAPLDIDSHGQVARFYSFDYSTLPRHLKRDMNSTEREKTESEFNEKMEKVASEMEKTAPNLKAFDQYEVVKEKEKKINEEFEQARKHAQEMTQNFKRICQQRYDRFMSAYSHISSQIESIYKALTKSATYPMGGTANLTLENDDEPFLYGIKYSTMPPSKRYREMEHLSGGEKTVAALALLFAIHSYKPSPFFILDEVDAALDNVNVAKVANFIREKSRDEKEGEGEEGRRRGKEILDGFQCIVISLKDQFYVKSDGLIGVYRDENKSSKTLTLDLERYSD